MALQAVGSIWAYKNRGCVVTGHGTKTIPPRHPGQKALTWNVNRVTFLDGKHPLNADIATKDFERNSKPLARGARAYFQRIYELKTQGMLTLDAMAQASAELAKGIGQNPEGVQTIRP